MPPLEDFVTFFKNLNEITLEENEIDINLDIVDVNIINEHIKSTADLMIPLYTKLFYIMLDHSIFPVDAIKPIFKNKGSHSKLDNYRPITLFCCSSKLFINILNARLNLFIEENNILNSPKPHFVKDIPPPTTYSPYTQ